MKILELQLLAFGPFTDMRLDLSGGQEGLHLVFGNNAFGKSSTLRAITGLLYGIPPRTRDDHIHSKRDLRVGARLRRSDGTQIEFVRRKGRKRTLLDIDGEPLSEDILEPFLRGVPMQRFMDAVGIDHERLVAGGRLVLEGEGDVGEVLMEAGAGGAQLRRLRDALSSEAEALFAPNARTRPINRAIRAYEEAVRRERAATLSPDAWKKKDSERRAAQAKRDHLVEERSALERTGTRLSRLSRTLPKVARLESLQQELQRVSVGPLLSKDATESRQVALRTKADASYAADTARSRIRELTGKRAQIGQPGALLARADTINRLHQGLQEYRSSLVEEPRLLARIEQLDREAQQIVAELRPGMDPKEVETLRPSRSVRAHLEALADRHGPVMMGRARADEELETARRNLASFEARLADHGDVADVQPLREALRRAQRDGDVLARLETSKRAVTRARGRAKRAAMALGVELESFFELKVPTKEVVERYIRKFDRSEQSRLRAEDRLEEAEEEHLEQKAKLAELTGAGDVPTEAGLGQARKRRDEHLEKVIEDPSLVDEYRELLKDADRISDRLRREADRVARQSALLAQVQASEARIKRAHAVVGRSRDAIEELDAEWQKLWRAGQDAPNIDPEPPREMLSWIDGHASLEEDLERIDLLAEEAKQLDEAVAGHRTRLSDALELVGRPLEAGLDVLLDRAISVVDEIEAADRRRAAIKLSLGQSKRDLETREVAARTARQAVEDWTAGWGDAVRRFGLDSDASVAETRAVLEALDDLFSRIDDRAQYARGLEELRAERSRTQTETQKLVVALAADLAQESTEDAIVELHARLIGARQDKIARTNISEQIDDTQHTLDSAVAAIRAQDDRLQALMRKAGVDDIDGLLVAEERSTARRELMDQIRQLEEQLLELGDGASLVAVCDEARSADRDALESERNTTERRMADVTREISYLDQELGKLGSQLDELDGRSEAASAAEDAQAAVAEVRAGVERFVKLKLAVGILRRHMDDYRERNEGPLLKRAARWFAHFTLGEFESIETRLRDDDRPVILGVRPSGDRVHVTGMSEGTRDQLFLALRLAAVEHQLDGLGQEPMPFIVDDILVGFDDERARAALEVLGELSRRTQVIFFTHHAHLTDIARAAVPEGQYFEHHLPTPPAQEHRRTWIR